MSQYVFSAAAATRAIQTNNATPLSYTPPSQQFNSFKVTVQQLDLFTSATLAVTLFNNTTYVKTDIIKLTGADYSGWDIHDDSYIMNYVENWLKNTYGA